MRPGMFSDCSIILTRAIIWWNGRSRLEKWLLVSSIVSLSVCLALALVLFATFPYSSNKENQGRPHSQDPSSVCLTPGCISIAAKYIRRANLSADPCEDFYNYACGEYEANTIIPDQGTDQTSFKTTEDELNIRLKAILDNPPDGDENDAFGKVRAYYNECKNTTELNNLKETPLTDLLQQLGGWPVIEGERWSSEAGLSYQWEDTIYALRNVGILHNILLDLSVGVDWHNSSKYIIELAAPSFGMPSSSYLLKGINDTLVQKYLHFMVNTAVLLGADQNSAETELTEVVKFEIKLANFTNTNEDRRNVSKLYNKKTLQELQKLAPLVNWVEYTNQLLMDQIDENETVIVVSLSYLRNLTHLLTKTPKRTVANYVMWRAVLNTIGKLDERFITHWMAYISGITGQTVADSRWKLCLASTKVAFDIAIGAMYVRRYLDQTTKDKAITLVDDIKHEFLTILKNVDWMDPATLDKAITKAKAMDEMIAYPRELMNDTALEYYYRNVLIEENNLFDSALRIKKDFYDRQYIKLRKVHKRHDWTEIGAVAVVNAFYSRSQNLIRFPAGILQGIFFGTDRPSYVNYGIIGSVIGHEITHGFDDIGRQFDDKGNLNEWWKLETELKFKDKIKCIINQYSNYTITSVNMTINGVNTQSENMADNGGVKIAYRAYENWVANNKEEKPLPGLKFTTRQLFWMSFANGWCSKTKPEAIKLRLLTDSHSPYKFRVNGVVSNLQEFSTDFQCPVGSAMNPTNKCVIW